MFFLNGVIRLLVLFGLVLSLLLVSLSIIAMSLLILFPVNVRLLPLGSFFSVRVSLIIVGFVTVVVIVTSLGSELFTRPIFLVASLLVVRLLALMAAYLVPQLLV